MRGWKINGQRIQAIRWTDMRMITEGRILFDYSNLYFHGAFLKTLHLSSEYEDLIAQIKQKIDERDEIWQEGE